VQQASFSPVALITKEKLEPFKCHTIAIFDHDELAKIIEQYGAIELDRISNAGEMELAYYTMTFLDEIK